MGTRANPGLRRAVSAVLATCTAAALLAAAPLAAAPLDGLPGEVHPVFDGDPVTTERIDAASATSAAVAVSQRRFAAAGDDGRHAAFAVLSRDDDFADSLTGSALTGAGPLLFTASGALSPETASELDRVLGGSGRVLVLGGPEAIAPAVTDAVTARGYTVERLAGETRVETAIAVADALRSAAAGEAVMLARASGTVDNPTAAWADSVSAGGLAAAARTPILLTPTEGLHPAVAAWLAEDDAERVVLLGGEAALSDAVLTAVPGAAERAFGAERTATAAAIAEDLWGATGEGEERYVVLDGGGPDGWAYGLAGAGLSADGAAPALLVVGGGVGAPARRLVSRCGDPSVDLLLVGTDAVVSPSVAADLDALDGSACADPAVRLRSFDGCEATLDHLREEGLARVGPYGLDGYWYGGPEPFPAEFDEPSSGTPTEDGAEPEPAPGTSPPPPPPAPPPPPGAPAEGTDGDAGGEAGGDEHSGTNVQEVGVDEPDISKTDGERAFVVSAGALSVLDVSGGAPAVTATVDLTDRGYDHELLLDGDTLVVLSRGDGHAYDGGDDVAASSAPASYYPEPTTTLTRYDVTDGSDPVEVERLELDGSYRTARAVDGVARIVLSSNPTGLDFVWPREETQEAYDEALARNREEIATSTIDDWLPAYRLDGGADQPLLPCGSVHAPPGFSGISLVTVLAVPMTTGLEPTSAAAVVASGEIVYASPERLVVSTSRWGTWTGDVAPTEGVSTEVHSFDIDDPAETRYVASGQVDGYVLNQFSLSERDGYYRIATTTDPPWTDDGTQAGETDNGVTILSEGGGALFEVSRLFGLGAGERIFAVRFLGDLAAVVTFRQTDPLHLIDLADPASPQLLGELHVPGFSSYLHPIGDDHLLGVGQDADEEGRTLGLQVSLFDLHDRTAPERVDQVTYGQGGSEVEYDHRAFLWWAPAARAVVPYYLWDTDTHGSGDAGASVLDVDAAAGNLDEVGRVRHPADEYGYVPQVRRSFVIADRLYTVSDAGVAQYRLGDLEPQGFAGFPSYEPCCGAPPEPAPEPEPVPVDDGGAGVGDIVSDPPSAD